MRRAIVGAVLGFVVTLFMLYGVIALMHLNWWQAMVAGFILGMAGSYIGGRLAEADGE